MSVVDASQLRSRLRDAFVWRGDPTDEDRYADVTGWWRDAELLRLLGPALADLFPEAAPTVVLGPDSRGSLIGPLVATHLRIGFVEVRKNRTPASDSDQWIRRSTPPDYRDRHLELGFRRGLIQSPDHVLVIDDWIDTGSQARTIRAIVDALHDSRLRRDLRVRSLLHVRDL